MGITCLWIGLIAVLGARGALGKTASACYGVNSCDFYTMECNQGEIIRLNSLQVGRNNLPQCANNTQHCSYKEACCIKTAGDPLEDFSPENTYLTYRNCSARQKCTQQSPWQLMPQVGATSNYVHLDYSCEPRSEKLNFCGAGTGPSSATGNYVEILFDGSRRNPSKECECTVTRPRIWVQQVDVTVIDLRLESYQKVNNTAACSSAEFEFPGYVKRCANTSQHFNINFLRDYTRSFAISKPWSKITLKNLHVNGEWDSPAVIWMSLKETYNDNFTVSCREVIHQDTTTSPKSSTTTTTPKPTTTTITTTPKPTTTTITTTPKPTTTTSTTPKSTTTTTQPTTTTPKPTSTTSTTPKPTTTTTQPTTTTPKPTSTTSTAPKSTTTTTQPTSSTPKPTTTTSTTPKPTTTTTLTTPKLTTTSSTTTPKPTTTTTTTTPKLTTTTTPKPITTSTTTTTTTTTTPKPTTTTTTTTTRPTTPQPTTTSTSTTLKPTTTTTATTTTTIKPPATTRTSMTTTQRMTTTAPPEKFGDGIDDDYQEAQLYMAIFIPIALFLIILMFFFIWILCVKSGTRRKELKLLRPDDRNALAFYNRFSNVNVVDSYMDKRRHPDVYVADDVSPCGPAVLSADQLSDHYHIPNTHSADGGTFRL